MLCYITLCRSIVYTMSDWFILLYYSVLYYIMYYITCYSILRESEVPAAGRGRPGPDAAPARPVSPAPRRAPRAPAAKCMSLGAEVGRRPKAAAQFRRKAYQHNNIGLSLSLYIYIYI